MPILVTCECGKQFQAKDENVGRRFNCTECGREISVPKPDSDPFNERPMPIGAEPKTSGKAIASLVLGILSMVFCFVFTGLPAIILGAFGISSINGSKGRIGGKGLAIAGIVTGSIGTFLMVPILLALLLPAVQAAREAARRAQCINNLKQIGLALVNYEQANKHFPAAAIVDKEGKPLLSWRVAILPYMEQNSLYEQFKLDEPWDSPNNKKLLAMMPNTFRCPSDPAAGTMSTKYQVIVGPGTIFDGPEGRASSSITDGTSNTFLAVEGITPVEWTKPDDIDIANVTTAIGSFHPGGSNALFADGSVKFIKRSVMPQTIQALATREGGEVIATSSY